MKLRNLKMNESIVHQYKDALKNKNVVLNPTEAAAIEIEAEREKKLDKDFKEVEKTTEEVIKATTNKEAIKVKDRKDLGKLIKEAVDEGKEWKVSRCEEEGYRYLFETVEPSQTEEKEVLNESTEEPQPEQSEEVLTEEKQELTEESNYDKIMKVLNKYDDATDECLKEEDEAVEVEAEAEVEETDSEEPKSFEEQIDFLIGDEQEAIDGYNQVIASIEDEHVKEQLQHLMDEEIAHKEFLEAFKNDQSLTYEHHDDTEEEAETEVVEEQPVEEVVVVEEEPIEEGCHEEEELNEETNYDKIMRVLDVEENHHEDESLHEEESEEESNDEYIMKTELEYYNFFDPEYLEGKSLDEIWDDYCYNNDNFEKSDAKAKELFCKLMKPHLNEEIEVEDDGLTKEQRQVLNCIKAHVKDGWYEMTSDEELNDPEFLAYEEFELSDVNIPESFCDDCEPEDVIHDFFYQEIWKEPFIEKAKQAFRGE